MPVFTCERARSSPAWTAALTGKIAKIRKFTEHVLPELHRFTGVKYSEGRTSLYIFFPQPLFHFNCARDLRVPTARAFHAPQLIQRRAEKTRAWPLYSSPETDKLDLTPLNKKELWFRSGFLPPQGGVKREERSERKRIGEPWRNWGFLWFVNARQLWGLISYLREINILTPTFSKTKQMYKMYTNMGMS